MLYIVFIIFVAANGRLKLLLSFAVGGLLGDVFLHLLPEAWAHLRNCKFESHNYIPFFHAVIRARF